MADTQQRPAGGRVVTEHEAANAAIGELRKIAGVLKQLGDESVGYATEEKVADLQSKLDDQARHISEMEHEEEEHSRLLDAVADFDRGIIDRDELVNLAREMSHAD